MMESEPLRIADFGSYVLFEYYGKFSVEASKRVVDLMAKASEDYGCANILLDCRRIQGELPIFERFQVAVYGAGMRQVIRRLALLRRPDMPFADNIVENAAVNRGMNLRSFDNFDKAVQWLTEDMPNQAKDRDAPA